MKTTIALVGLKPVPVIVKVNACPLIGGDGDVTILATLGAAEATDMDALARSAEFGTIALNR